MAISRSWNKNIRTDELGHAIPEKIKDGMAEINYEASKEANAWLSANRSSHYDQIKLGPMPTEAQAEALFKTNDKTSIVAFLNGSTANKYLYLPWLLPLAVRNSMRKPKVFQVYRKDSYGGVNRKSVTDALDTPIDFVIIGGATSSTPTIYVWDTSKSHIGSNDFDNYFSGMIETELVDDTLDVAEDFGYIRKSDGARIKIASTVKSTKKGGTSTKRSTKRGNITSN